MSVALREPKQARSVETYGRLLDAAEAIMGEKSFDDATIEEIVSRAGLTTGAFYARFRNKEALLRHLEDRMTSEFTAVFSEVTDGASASARGAELLERIIGVWAREYARRRPVARALVLRSHTDAQVHRRLQDLNRLNHAKIFRRLTRESAIRHPNRALAVDFALLAARSVLRETILFREVWPGRPALPEEGLVRELTRMTLAYLGFSGSGDDAEDEE
jgi:AcrR family transcriptional regulator